MHVWIEPVHGESNIHGTYAVMLSAGKRGTRGLDDVQMECSAPHASEHNAENDVTFESRGRAAGTSIQQHCERCEGRMVKFASLGRCKGARKTRLND